MKDAVLKFLKEKKEKFCVLATASKNGKTESAVLGYAVKDDFTILLSTHEGSRKVQNILENNQVSLIVGWSFTEAYVQSDCIASIIKKDNQSYADDDQFFFSINPHAAQFKTPDTIFIAIKPVWIRFTDFSSSPPKVEEINL